MIATRITALLVCITFVIASRVEARQASPPATQPIVLARGLVITAVGRASRSPSLVDPIEAQVVAGTWKAPQENSVMIGVDGREHHWKPIDSRDGAYADETLDRNGWLYVPVDSQNDCVALMTASGHSMVYVNGEPRVGDPYEAGYVTLPIALHAGRNDLLFASAGRGHVRIDLRPVDPNMPTVLLEQDMTTPDSTNHDDVQWVGVLVANLSVQPFQGTLNVVANDSRAPIGPILPYSIRKVSVPVSTGAALKTDRKATHRSLSLRDQQGRELGAPLDVALRVRNWHESYKRTFRSAIDDSTQYYAICAGHDFDSRKRALVLSLHGASVEATSQADAYSAKDWCDIVCATNRRPFGFDWEDWGRLDALEVLAEGEALFEPDRSRIYLTGHSMGGHGTWQLGSLFPDTFAAIGASAGWLSFQTYGAPRPGVTPPTTVSTQATAATTASTATQVTTRPSTRVADDLASIFRRAAATSDTASIMPNLAPRGVYILHGTDDDNVPIDQAKAAVKILSAFHHDFTFHEQPSANHWWDVSDEPGADCVDWAPMFDFFARHRLPSANEVRDVDFRTPNPSVSSRLAWLTIDAQQRSMEMSHAKLRFDPGKQRIVGETENVARMSIDLLALGASSLRSKDLQLQLDGANSQSIKLSTSTSTLWLARDERSNAWSTCDPPSTELKCAARSGPFKMAFANHMTFVYGTHGSSEENAATLAKARYDAEVWWYRGNGSVDVLADDAFDAAKRAGNVILYGNADTNAAWRALLGERCPIDVRRGEVRVGETIERGDDLACLFVYPRNSSPSSLVACVSGTGPAGIRLTNRLPYFASGVGYPDWCVMGPEVLKLGANASRAAGYFDNEWKLR